VPAALIPNRRKRLGELLVEQKLLTDAQLHGALLEQKKWGGRLGVTVVELGFVDENQLVQVLASQLNLPVVNLDAEVFHNDIAKLLRLDLAERYGVFPLSNDGQTLRIATSDPTSLEQLQELGFALGKRIVPSVATAHSIERAIRRYYFGEVPGKPETDEPVAIEGAVEQHDTNSALAELMGENSAPLATPDVKVPSVAAGVSMALFRSLEQQVVTLTERTANLEASNSSLSKALRAVLELLVESGLMSRDEYVEKMKKL
jgi:type IV pilus assembly protein PilB